MSVKRGGRTHRCARAVIGAHATAPVRTDRHLGGRNRKRMPRGLPRCVSCRVLIEPEADRDIPPGICWL